ncbi:hypothetical protein K493DRAFT_317014 [Basidiobolus meristosporus CBS 931.73]|uniref:Small ribosomal subunit protein mS41 n=1 Tax=Basidiobolus meristosporus CBS 931.73 TaxID=1314790 RepID=A0A1Y1Y273_9FUNG|nr:hypothetical protein K493DRAFT_317014 [Basidiobolus meristosporus CBS 931.73]|eukprot:ORX91826.1 hypothetical protein K493DRAFT_317014 [Basidiobolus meristosporus CBS 931.73]
MTIITRTFVNARPFLSRSLHAKAAPQKSKRVPAPRGEFKDPQSFLNKIRRGCEEAADKFKDWEHLFTVTRNEMKHDMGLTPQQRKWILKWTELYRQGVDPYLIPKPVKRKS